MKNKTVILIAATILIAKFTKPCAAGGMETARDIGPRAIHFLVAATGSVDELINQSHQCQLDPDARLVDRVHATINIGRVAVDGWDVQIGDTPADRRALSKLADAMKYLGSRDAKVDPGRHDVVDTVLMQLFKIPRHYNQFPYLDLINDPEKIEMILSRDKRKVAMAFEAVSHVFNSTIYRRIQNNARKQIENFAKAGPPDVAQIAAEALKISEPSGGNLQGSGQLALRFPRPHGLKRSHPQDRLKAPDESASTALEKGKPLDSSDITSVQLALSFSRRYGFNRGRKPGRLWRIALEPIYLRIPLNETDLSPGAVQALERLGISTTVDLVERFIAGDLVWPSTFNPKHANEAQAWVHRMGFRPKIHIH